MASAKKIAANKRNAARSTGPRSAPGKRRVSRNAYRHGLSQGVSSRRQFNEELDKRARELAEGLNGDPLALENARTIAEAELDISRARSAKVSVVERVSAFGALNPPRFTDRAIKGWFKAFDEGLDPPVGLAMEGADPMPPEGPDRTAEAVRRALPELLKLDRYERRAAARRDRAVRQLCRSRRAVKEG